MFKKTQIQQFLEKKCRRQVKQYNLLVIVMIIR